MSDALHRLEQLRHVRTDRRVRKVEALYDTPKELHAAAEGAEMAMDPSA